MMAWLLHAMQVDKYIHSTARLLQRFKAPANLHML